MTIKNGFTLIELIVVIAITVVLSGIVLFSVTLFVNKGKDSNISGNLVVLIPAGEVFYNASNSYEGFCESSIVASIVSQMPQNLSGACPCVPPSCKPDDANTWTSVSNPAGVCCYVEPQYSQAWAACAKEFANSNYAYCVDSRGVRKEIPALSCQPSSVTSCSF